MFSSNATPPKFPVPRDPDQRPPAPRFPKPRIPNQRFPAQRIPHQDFSVHHIHSPSFRPGLPRRTFPAQRFPDQRLTAPRFPNQRFPNQRFATPRIPHQGFPGHIPNQMFSQPGFPSNNSSSAMQHGQKRKYCETEAPDVLSEAPREIKITEYAEARAAEIEVLSSLVYEHRSNRLAIQVLPRHMRRRAMSHNIKRLPRSRRLFALKEVERVVRTKYRCPSRKHRRKPGNLLQEYNRRQRKHVWLETHIWHAKRFHMVNKWGYRLPFHPTDKSERASYRATSQHCMLQDVSYMCCMEISGTQEDILSGISHLTNTATGPTVAAKAFLNGAKEGNSLFYKFDQYPRNLIGCISFLWRPSEPIRVSDGGKTNQRQLWLWCHPAIFEEVWAELLNCFNLTENIKSAISEVEVLPENKDIESSMEAENTVSESETSEKDKEGLNNSDKITPSMNKHCTVSNESIVLRSLKDSLQRFRLTGPRTVSLLLNALHLADICATVDSDEPWWKKYYAADDTAILNSQQREFWESVKTCCSPAELTPHTVVALTVKDPRVLKPEMRTKTIPDTLGIDSDISVCKYRPSPDVASSPLWEEEIRQEIKTTKMSDHKLNQMKSDHLVPGTLLDLGPEESRVPVLLIQRPGVQLSSSVSGGGNSASPSCCMGYGSGWDIILPAGWGMPFWIAFVYRGARVGGLRESRSLAAEQGVLHFPQDYPDTLAGKQEIFEISKEAKEKYDKRPPAKRPNYIKLGVLHPFSCPWELLVSEWCQRGIDNKIHDQSVASEEDTSSKAYVLRCKKTLRFLNKLCQTNITQPRQKGKRGTVKAESGSVKTGSELSVSKLTSFLESSELPAIATSHKHALVPVKVAMINRGTPGQIASICIPKPQDLTELKKDSKYGGPSEPLHADPNKKSSKKLKKVEEPDSSACVVGHCTRDTCGYLHSGGFSLGQGSGAGIGFCSLIGLLHLLQSTPVEHPARVLVRDKCSLQYRFGCLSILE